MGPSVLFPRLHLHHHNACHVEPILADALLALLFQIAATSYKILFKYTKSLNRIEDLVGCDGCEFLVLSCTC